MAISSLLLRLRIGAGGFLLFLGPIRLAEEKPHIGLGCDSIRGRGAGFRHTLTSEITRQDAPANAYCVDGIADRDGKKGLAPLDFFKPRLARYLSVSTRTRAHARVRADL